jgi:hypothetical protein
MSPESCLTPAEVEHVTQLAARYQADPAARAFLAVLARMSKVGTLYDPSAKWTNPAPMSPESVAWVVADVLAGMVEARRREACREAAARTGQSARVLAEDVGLGWA